MDTKKHFKERGVSSVRAGVLFGVGLALGCGLGFVMGRTYSAGIEFGGATHLIACSLGAISVLITWWVLGYEVTRTNLGTSMDTRERLRVQRRSYGWAGTFMGVGLALGSGLGAVIGRAATTCIELGWGTHLIAYGLGVIGLFATWWALGYEVTRTKKLES
jgi:hypothetical protein